MSNTKGKKKGQNVDGHIVGSVYERYKGERLCGYVAEIQFQGTNTRRTFKTKELARQWADMISEDINACTDDYNETKGLIESDLKRQRADLMSAAYSDYYDKVKVIWDKYRTFEDPREMDGANVERTKEVRTYLIRDELSGSVKIGKSTNIGSRLRYLGRATVKLLAVLDKDVENELHQSYVAKHIGGEWYRLDASDILEIITQYKFQIAE